jgi:hypothetical protein
MFARVLTVFSVDESALVVPEEAIVPQGGKQFVIRIETAPWATGPCCKAPSKNSRPWKTAAW